MFEQIRVVILDHNPGIVDGYLYWLRDHDPIEVVGTVTSGEQLEVLLARDSRGCVVVRRGGYSNHNEGPASISNSQNDSKID